MITSGIILMAVLLGMLLIARELFNDSIKTFNQMATKKVTTTKPAATAVGKAKPFNKMSKAEKRMALAQDVIDQLKLKRIIANSGDYVRKWNIDYDNNDNKISGDCELQDILPMTTCEVCAKGALFIADVLRRDKLSVNDARKGISNPKIMQRLADIFIADQLDLIETAFEGAVINDKNETLYLYDDVNSNETPLAEKAIKFYNKHIDYDDESKGLIAIMKNIIKNNGEFKP